MGDDLQSILQDNLDEINRRIYLAASSSNRKVEDVKLIVVTKAQSLAVTRAVLQAGVRRVGENYPEETLLKIQELNDYPDVEWHMIGHLQSRKGTIVAEHFTMLHSLDSLRLAVKLNRLLEEQKRVLPVLLEFNVSNESDKYGWPAWDNMQWDRLLPELEQIVSLPWLRVEGLMAMPPLFDDPQKARPYFSRLAALQDFFVKKLPQADWRELSMGTSADFEVAVQEGATFVRVGQAILGPRPQKIT